jgi:hypothetical protein
MPSRYSVYANHKPFYYTLILHPHHARHILNALYTMAAPLQNEFCYTEVENAVNPHPTKGYFHGLYMLRVSSSANK